MKKIFSVFKQHQWSQSAKINGLKPYEYIEYILTRMTGNKLTADLLEKIMPWSEELPKNLYKNKKA